MKKIVLILFTIFLMSSTNAQNDSICGTEDTDSTDFDNQPWIGNNDFLEHFLDSIGYPAKNSVARIISPMLVFFTNIDCA